MAGEIAVLPGLVAECGDIVGLVPIGVRCERAGRPGQRGVKRDLAPVSLRASLTALDMPLELKTGRQVQFSVYVRVY